MKNLVNALIATLLPVGAVNAADISILVRKSERSLTVYQGEKIFHQFKIALGPAPEGIKMKEGDGKTPEGQFTVCVKNPNSKFHLSIGLDYPRIEDGERGLQAGLIDAATLQQIREAHQAKRTPPWNTPLGGEIFIHGGGSSSDWTLGCVALENQDIETLFPLIRKGTVVTIQP